MVIFGSKSTLAAPNKEISRFFSIYSEALENFKILVALFFINNINNTFTNKLKKVNKIFYFL